MPDRREILPIPDRPYAGPVLYDAKAPDATFPPIRPVRPPELTARHEEIPAWDDMPEELKPVLRRQMENYAGFLEGLVGGVQAPHAVDHHRGGRGRLRRRRLGAL